MVPADGRACWALPVFAVGEARATWADVAAFAQRDGRWELLVRAAREGLACERAGHAAEPAAVQRAATEFRYRHRLLTGEETEAWLRARHVAVAEWSDYMRRSVLRAQHGAEAVTGDLPDLPDPPDAADVDALLWPTGRCGGLLDRFALALAERVAAHVRLTGDVPTQADDVDTAMERFRAVVVTDEAVRSVVGSRHLDWIAVAVDEAHFTTEGAAREAVLCVRDDGLDLSRVCDVAGARLVHRRAFLEELDATRRALVLGARPGDLLGPFAAEDGFVVARVEAKVMPSEDDAEVRRRAGEVALAAAVRREVEERVRWHDR